MAWSPQQDIALKKVEVWFREYKLKRGKGVKQYFYLAGFAGVGKTTLAKHFAENVNGDVAFGAFSGKAALVPEQYIVLCM
jgi:exodeoxyribonuclease-5